MKKYLIYLVLALTFMFNVNALTVQDTTGQPINQPVTNTGILSSVSINWNVIIPITIIAIVIGLLLMIIMWFVSKIVKKIKISRRQKEDLEYYKYSLDLKNANMNKNSKYKYRNILTLFLMWKKAKIYARTSRGRKLIGYYDGELVKKEGFFVMAIELRYSFFKREVDLVIFPYELTDELIFFNDDRTIDLEVEGIDEVLSSELFSLPVFKNNSKRKEIFADFSDRVYKDYFEKFGNRKSHIDTIKDSAVKIREATEQNPSVPYQRKTGNDLQG